MKEAIANLAYAAKKSFGISGAVLITLFTPDKTQATDKVIFATGNDIENAFGEMPSYGRNFDITTGREFDASSLTEANNAARGDSTLTSFQNEIESKDFSTFPLEQLILRLDQIKERQSKKGNTLMQTIRLGKIRQYLELYITTKKAAAESEAKDAKIAALDKKIKEIDKEQEALDKELAKEKEKLRIVKTFSNPQ